MSKNYFNLTKLLVLRLFKMVKNQAEWSRLEQTSMINFFLVEKCKPCEIYWRMFNVYGEACFNQKMFINGLIMGLSLRGRVEKTVHGVEIHWLWGKKGLDIVVSKESLADSVLGHKRSNHYWFPWKRCD